jgi:hypothetical protein
LLNLSGGNLMVVLFDTFIMSDDIFEVIFSTKQQSLVAKLLVQELKNHGKKLSKSEMSLFATSMHEGTFETFIEDPIKGMQKVRISYNKRQFYDRILTPMKSMGLIYFDLYKKDYTLSNQFTKEIQKIGILWVRELDKPLGTPIKKKDLE